MSWNPFDPPLDALPGMLPIFPLPGVVLLPRGQLPLNVFEPRYMAMVDDILAGDRLIGMIQPTDPACRRRSPTVYETGCAGRVTRFSETDDGRYLVTLTGVCRFSVQRELAPGRGGYRCVVPAWERFVADLEGEAEAELDRPRLLVGLKTYFRNQGITANWDAIENSPDERLITSLAMICPFDSCEKQALLEAPNLAERARLLIALIEMAVLDPGEGSRLARH